jgi:hypothetical protein
MSTRVFVSVGRTATTEQEEHVARIFQLLRVQGMDPICVGRTKFSAQNPLVQIRDEMRTCAGLVVIAFERLHITAGTELRGGGLAKDLAEQRMPTVWNQIEAAMGYVQDKPLLMIVEKGLRLEGLLSPRYDWYVQEVSLAPAAVSTDEFVGIFADWKTRVESQASKLTSTPSPVDLQKITVSQIWSSLTVPQLVAVFGFLAVFATGAATVGAKFLH